MELEKKGIPTATICTDIFASLAREEAETLGIPELPIVIIPHPLGGESPDGVYSRSVQAVEQLVAALTQEP